MDIQSALEGIIVYPHYIQPIRCTGIEYDSNKVKTGSIFVAIPGKNADGHHYIADAVRSGAAAIVGERPPISLPVPYIQVKNARQALALLARQYFQSPSERHRLIGVTGTNGKTTTTHMIHHMLRLQNISCAMIGSLGCEINGKKIDSEYTTPDAVQLHRLLQECRDDLIVMETSSHGIDQHRIGGLSFDYACFTNLSHDHLDYHGSMEHYYVTKRRLFSQLKRDGEAIVVAKDSWGHRLQTELMRMGKNVFTAGESSDHHVQVLDIVHDDPVLFRLKEGDEQYVIQLMISGEYNAWNAAAAWLTVRRIGLEPKQIQAGLASFRGVPGRFETFPHPEGALFVVDYAHTPDAFAQFLETLRKRKRKRLIHIFGFHEQRDRSKRNPMLNISKMKSDIIILTQDELKGRPLNEYMQELKLLAHQCDIKNVRFIPDRIEAIKYAWSIAGAGDIVAITGKGADRYEQSFALPFTSDVETIQAMSKQLVTS